MASRRLAPGRLLALPLLSAPGLCALWLTLLPFCDALFDCGCRWSLSWAEGVTHCNIHDASTHDCPWCVGGPWRQLILMAGLSALLLAAVWWSQRWRRWWASVLVGVMAVPPAVFLAGLITALLTGYPFLGRLIGVS